MNKDNYRDENNEIDYDEYSMDLDNYEEKQFEERRDELMEKWNNVEENETFNLIDIVNWNKERGLLNKPFDLTNELSMVLEEIVEARTGLESKQANPIARELIAKLPNKPKSPEELMDDFSDMVVFAVGAMTKLGFNPNKVMQETLKEINSRVGSIDENGKFIKDITKKHLWYTADYTKAKNHNT